MKRLLLATALLMPACAYAQQNDAHPTHQTQGVNTPQALKPEPVKDASSLITQGINDVFDQLARSLKEADGLAVRLKELSAKTSGDVANQVGQAENTLGNLSDKLSPQGDLAAQLKGLRDAAQQHLERVQKLPGEFMDDEDRTRILNGWQKVMQDADSAAGNMSMMREQIGVALLKLRRKEAAVSEMLLVNEFQAAVATIKNWTADLQNTLGNLHRVIDAHKPTS